MRIDTFLSGSAGGARSLAQVFAQIGDLLADVAQRYGVSEGALRAANPGLGDRLPTGHPVRLPDAADAGGLVDGTPAGSATLGSYSVRSGDTMAGIAKAHGLSLSALIVANPQVRNPNLISPGQILRLPGGDARGDQHLPSNEVTTHRLGSLSEKYETGGRGAGTVSSGQGDPGGVSYGSYQLASKTGTLRKFLAHEGAQWAPELIGMDPKVPGGEFGKQWKAIAARSPEEFAQAQHAFIARTHYQPVVDGVLKSTGEDLSKRSPAVQDAVWSTSVQHGQAEAIVARAVGSVKLDRSDPGYDHALVNAIYDQRSNYIDGLSKLPAATKNSLHKRYERERADALAMLSNP